MTFHNSALARLVPDGNYRADDLARVEAALSDHQTLTFVRLPSGLYSASSAGESIAATGHANVWVRDNIYVAFAHHVTGARHIATEIVGALIGFFTRYWHRFDDIISGAVDRQNVANRPHVRFDGRTLSEIGDQRWAHVQNDALGYFLWLLAQITDDWRCAEAYYLRAGEYVANPHLPLQWTQANLTVAMNALRATLFSDGR